MISEFSAQASLQILENSDPGSFLQQWVLTHCLSFLHLVTTLENSTQRHFLFEPPAADFPARSAVRFEPCWLGALSIPGRFHALELGAAEELAAFCEKRFNVGFDFATILSSPVPCGILFDIVSGQLAELNMLKMNRWRRWFHSSRVTLPFARKSASWFLVSTNSIWIFWVQVDSVKEPLKRNSVGSGCVSRCWTSALDDHLDHRFTIKCTASHKIEKTSRLRKHNRRCIIQDRCTGLES